MTETATIAELTTVKIVAATTETIAVMMIVAVIDVTIEMIAMAEMIETIEMVTAALDLDLENAVPEENAMTLKLKKMTYYCQ
jgi:hypothetical protein